MPGTVDDSVTPTQEGIELAQLVGAFGSPHVPSFTTEAEEDTPLGEELRRLYGEMERRLSATGPDALMIFSSDHYNSLFPILPTFGIGLADDAYGPNDATVMQPFRVDIDTSVAAHLLDHSVKSGFDITMVREFDLDHTFLVPYHFIAAKLGIPIIPVFLNGLVAPRPTSDRCVAFGRALAEGIASFPGDKRIAVLGSGSFSLDLGGVHEGGPPRAITDSAWVDRVVDYLGDAQRQRLVTDTTDEQIWRAGNVGGEILNWLAMLGTFDPQAPTFLERQGAYGHAFGAWELDGGSR